MNLLSAHSLAMLILTVVLAFVATPAIATEKTKNTAKQSLSKTTAGTSNDAPETQQEPAKMNLQEKTQPESVSAVSYDGENLNFTIISNGCTSPKHFEIEQAVTTDRCEITIVRTQPDFCRKVPQAVEITVPWSKPEAAETCALVVVNPLLERNTFLKSTTKDSAKKPAQDSAKNKDSSK